MASKIDELPCASVAELLLAIAEPLCYFILGQAGCKFRRNVLTCLKYCLLGLKDTLLHSQASADIFSQKKMAYIILGFMCTVYTGRLNESLIHDFIKLTML